MGTRSRPADASRPTSVRRDYGVLPLALYHAMAVLSPGCPQARPISTFSPWVRFRHRRSRTLAGMRLAIIAFLAALCWCGQASAAAAWRWPLDGPPRVTRGFDPPDTPYGAGHRGVDLAGVPGQAVRAAGAGRIGFAGVLAGRGVVTVLHAGGLKTTYEPVRAAVRGGQQVVIGQLIGRLQPGHAGCPVSACLHWGLLRGTRYLDPLSLVGAGHVRLLPLGGAANAAPPSVAGRVRAAASDTDVAPSSLTTQVGVTALGLAALLAIRRRGP
jgi:hypothetical protein